MTKLKLGEWAGTDERVYRPVASGGLEADNARLREALETIAAPRYGLQGLIEDEATDKEISDYYADEVAEMQRIARAALKERGDK